MKPFRPINKRVAEIIDPLPQGAYNFGLFFNKWFVIDRPKGDKPFKCQTEREIKGSAGKDWDFADNLPISIELFNNGKVKIGNKKGSWNRDLAAAMLARKQEDLNRVADAYRRLGYQVKCYVLELQSPLIIGLGGEHPTEKGFRFDWNLGIPYVPAGSIKGVVRLAHLIELLNQETSHEAASAFWEKICDGLLPESARDLFGCGEKKKEKNKIDQEAKRGQVIFLDAFPVQLPQFKAEIMNCHYKEYLNEGKKGPTEDQDPNPQKFWALNTYDHGGKPLRFVFHVLVAKEVADSSRAVEYLDEAFLAAVQELGLGAKTAIGHGRFRVPASDKSSSDGKTHPGKIAPASLPKDQEQVREERLNTFREQLKGCKNIAGEIDEFLNRVQDTEDRELKKEMAQVLLARAKKVKSFKNARKSGKQWVRRLENLAHELEIEF